MNKLLLLLIVVVFSLSSSIYAQKTVSGQVLENDSNQPIPEVSVLVKGTNKGATTDFDGNFAIKDVDANSVLIFSYMGFITQEITIGQQSVVNVTLLSDENKLDEVVVTALNIERDKASLGYSVAQIDAVEVNIVKDNNVMNSLTGKVSGLQITQANTGVDGSSRILLRGITTISGSNRPLVVVDGIPISGGGGGGGYAYGGTDSGDAMSDINPDDVESISVLKGAGASAAYGSLGMNGVIIITTKSGKRKGGAGISFSSSLMITDIMLSPDLQNEYGTGAFDQHAPIGADGKPVRDYPFSWSWGPKMEGQEYTNWLGEKDSFSPQGDPFKEFYQMGVSSTNSIVFEGSSEKNSFRLSITDQRSQGIVPNNTLKKQTYNLRASSHLTDRFMVDGRISYVRADVKNRPELAEGPSNTSLQLSLMAPDVRLEDLKNNTVDANGNELNPLNDPTFVNPYWALDNVYNEDLKDRFQGVISAKFDVNDHLLFTGKSGMDYILSDGVSHVARGARAIWGGLGNYTHGTGKSTLWNSDILGTYKTSVVGININASLGANFRYESGSSIAFTGVDEKVPNFYRIGNYKNVYPSDSTWKKNVYSFYGLAEISYGGFLYFDATIRNDNSSALPSENNSYWYHSENASLLFSKLFGIESKWFNMGKIRGSYATVGNDTGPYRTQSVYYINGSTTLDYTVASIPGSLPAADLKPEHSESWEVGMELGFFNNRINMDVTYYETLTTDQIMGVPISGTSGYSSKVVNAGSIKNTGIEASLNLIPVETTNFRWDMGINYTQSTSVVESLNEGLESIILGYNSNAGVTVEARPGEDFGSLYGVDFKRDNFDRILVSDYGTISKGEVKNFGSVTPDFYGGLTNNFKYKNISLRTTIAGQYGGVFYSYGRGYRMFFGTDQRSLEGRVGGIVIDGINENTGAPNTVAIPALNKQFLEIFSNQIVTNMMLDATNVRMKEIVLTYNFPKRMIQNSPIQGLSVSAIGTNLFFIYNPAGDIDPEAGYGGGTSGTAVELGSLPSTRSYGLNFNINF